MSSSNTAIKPGKAERRAQRALNRLSSEMRKEENLAREAHRAERGRRRRWAGESRPPAAPEGDRQLIMNGLCDEHPVAQIHAALIGESTDVDYLLAKIDVLIDVLEEGDGAQVYESELRAAYALRIELRESQVSGEPLSAQVTLDGVAIELADA